jgi:hypothetical protein
VNDEKKRVAILQSNYIPWKGYFDIIHSVDEFVWYDDVQYSKNGWRNRNKIITANGVQWLSVPCSGKGGLLINQVELKDPRWQEKHWKTISNAYSKAPFFSNYRMFLEDFYLGQQWEMLYQMNRAFIERVCQDFLGVKTKFCDAVDFEPQGKKQDRLLDVIEKVGADTYLSGPSAMDYIDENEFHCRGIDLQWMNYSGYPEYRQVYGCFTHAVSILDLLFNVGDQAPWYIWGWREDADNKGGG